MRKHGLGELAPDLVQRVQRGERVLEDHRDVVTADRAQLGVRQRDEVAALEQDAPRDARPLQAREPERRERGDGLAGPRLADDPERAPLEYLVGDAVDGVHDPVLGRELDLEVLDAQEQLAAHP